MQNVFQINYFMTQTSNSTQESGSLYQRFLCKPGEYNDMATLFYNPQEDAIKMLFHGDAG